MRAKYVRAIRAGILQGRKARKALDEGRLGEAFDIALEDIHDFATVRELEVNTAAWSRELFR